VHSSRLALVVGVGELAQRYASTLAKARDPEHRIVGYIADSSASSGRCVPSEQVVGTYDDMGEFLRHSVVGEVIFALPLDRMTEAEPAFATAKLFGLKSYVLTDSVVPADWRQNPHSDGFPLVRLDYRAIHDKAVSSVLKRAMDVAISLAACIILGPLLLATALLIKLTSPGPVFYVANRIGLHGRPIDVYKFRTMEVGADEKQENLRKQSDSDSPAFKMKDDPRVTRFGRFMRATSIDELPQLFNVLFGNMSLVGPRPLDINEAERCENWHWKRHNVKPGITCIWQVRGRSNVIDYAERMKMDLSYVDNWSHRLDLQLLWQTIPAVLFRKGAY